MVRVDRARVWAEWVAEPARGTAVTAQARDRGSVTVGARVAPLESGRRSAANELVRIEILLARRELLVDHPYPAGDATHHAGRVDVRPLTT